MKNLEAAKLKRQILWTTKNSQIRFTKQFKRNTKQCNNKIPEQLDLKVRPIVGRHKCTTSKLSNFIDILLKSFLKHIPGYIKNGFHSLNR